MNRLGDDLDWLLYHERLDGTVEIVDIAVNSERRQGKGRRLVELLFAELPPAARVFAITRADNEIAQRWYEALQFRVVGVLSRFYGPRVGVDAIMYGRKAGGPV